MDEGGLEREVGRPAGVAGGIVARGVGVGGSQGSIAPLGWVGTTIEGGEERVSGEKGGKRTGR
jgi:hypothetical protein